MQSLDNVFRAESETESTHLWTLSGIGLLVIYIYIWILELFVTTKILELFVTFISEHCNYLRHISEYWELFVTYLWILWIICDSSLNTGIIYMYDISLNIGIITTYLWTLESFATYLWALELFATYLWALKLLRHISEHWNYLPHISEFWNYFLHKLFVTFTWICGYWRWGPMCV